MQDMKDNFKSLLVVGMLMFPLISLGQGRYTQLSNVKIYSEYFPNKHAKFKGTIVFENGSGTPLTEWTENKIFLQCVKQLGSLFTYDRSGVGKSPPDLSMSIEKPMTAKLINSKLMKLLKKENIDPPYILVAHSYGGMYAGYFARKFPNLVQGILMVDPVPNNYEWSDNFLQRHNTTKEQIQQMQKISSKELYRKYSDANSLMSAQLFYQFIGFKQTKNQVNRLPLLSDKIPVVIVSSSDMEKNAPIKGNWYEQQKQWLNSNIHSKIIKVNSGHFVQLENPKLICEQIKTLISLTTTIDK